MNSMQVTNSILELIGKTPMVRLRRLVEDPTADVLVDL
jgi:cysteine synthase